MRTSCDWNAAIVSAALGLILSLIAMSPTEVPSVSRVSCLERTRTRFPSLARAEISVSCSSVRVQGTKCGAPTVKEPSPSISAAEYFLSEENGMRERILRLLSAPNFSIRARDVLLRLSSAPSIAAITVAIYSSSKPSAGITPSTHIVPSVIVPVLSRQSTSARASISIEYMSCTSVLFLASFSTLSVRVRVTRRYIPAGIMPMTEPLVFSTVFLRISPAGTPARISACRLQKKRSTVIGTMNIPMYLSRLPRSRKRSDCGFLKFFAACSSLCI